MNYCTFILLKKLSECDLILLLNKISEMIMKGIQIYHWIMLKIIYLKNLLSFMNDIRVFYQSFNRNNIR